MIVTLLILLPILFVTGICIGCKLTSMKHSIKLGNFMNWYSKEFANEPETMLKINKGIREII